MTKATTVQVRQWMLSLMARQAPQSVDDAKANIALSLPALKMRFQAETFCAGSIDAIAGTERFWNEAAVTRGLEAWERAHAPQDVTALPPEAEAAPFGLAGKNWVAGFYRCEDDEAMIRRLELIRCYAVPVFVWLANREPRAASIVVRMGWHVPERHEARPIEREQLQLPIEVAFPDQLEYPVIASGLFD